MIDVYTESMIGHVFTVQNTEKEDFWAFFNILGRQIIFHEKGEPVLQKEERTEQIYLQ